MAQGRYVWYELMTTDKAAAKAFYTKVVGWGAQDAEMPGMTYTMMTAGDRPVAGMMDLPETARKMNAPPAWIGYVGVEDVDASAAKAKSLGATIHVPPTDIPNVGRFAVIADPQGAVIALFKWSDPAADQPGTWMAPGTIGWHELLTSDWTKAIEFYSSLFGWKKEEAIDIGAMGKYQTFSAGDDHAVGGMFSKSPAIPASFWLYYVSVGNIDAAAERLKSAGGEIMMGPMEVPGGAWVIQARDPQGAAFALLGNKG
jgi:predicted enzyme related to lactoylglutathione lyase